jgi:hypothetical protein
MVLGKFASLLKKSVVALKSTLGERCGSAGKKRFDVEPAGRVLLEMLEQQLGDNPESVNQRSLLRHCLQAAQSVLPGPEIMPAELIATMLAYFMVQTVLPRTCGIAYCSRRHPLHRLVETSSQFATIDPAIASISAFQEQREKISTAILFVADVEGELLLQEKLLQSVIERIAGGLDVLVISENPDRAGRIADAAVPRSDPWKINFPFLESAIGLSGVSLRCFSSK